MEIVIVINKIYYDAYFSFSSNKYAISANQTSNSDFGYTGVYLSWSDLNSVVYQTNLFDLKVIKNHPPVVVYTPGAVLFYYGNLINSIYFSENPFMDDDTIKYSVSEWSVNNTIIVSYSKSNVESNILLSINVFFVKNFIGKWMYEIVATDLFGQTNILSFFIQVIPCSQKSCIKWSSQYQIDWELWADGYTLQKETGTWLATDYSVPFKSTHYLFIQIIVILNILFSIVAAVTGIKNEVNYIVFHSNQICLLLCLFQTLTSNKLLEFLSVLQLVKLDLKILDDLFYLRTPVNSIFYQAQFTSLSSIWFESGATFANFINLLVVMIFVLIAVYLLKLCKIKDADSEILNLLCGFKTEVFWLS